MNKKAALLTAACAAVALICVAALILSINCYNNTSSNNAAFGSVSAVRAYLEERTESSIADKSITFEQTGERTARVSLELTCEKPLTADVTVYAEPRWHGGFSPDYQRVVVPMNGNSIIHAEFDLRFFDYGGYSDNPYYFSAYARYADGTVEKLNGLDYMLTEDECCPKKK